MQDPEKPAIRLYQLPANTFSSGESDDDDDEDEEDGDDEDDGNQAIAERLTISEHTVHRHVANMLTKLGVPSRSAAVARAVSDLHGLFFPANYEMHNPYVYRTVGRALISDRNMRHGTPGNCR